MASVPSRPLWLLAVTACALGEAVIPWPGAWDYRDEGVIASTCPDDLYRDPDATFSLSQTSSTGFVIDEEASFACTLDGRTFGCPARRQIEIPVGETTLRWSVRVEGRFLTPRRMRGTQIFDVACTGGLCAFDEAVLGVSLPCTYEVGFSASAR